MRLPFQTPIFILLVLIVAGYLALSAHAASLPG